MNVHVATVMVILLVVGVLLHVEGERFNRGR